MFDSKSQRNCLLDTGSQVSLWPPTSTTSKFNSSNVKLIAANGTPIKSFGKQRREIQFGGKSYSFIFHIAQVTRPILGMDFLETFRMAIDLHSRRLLHSGRSTRFTSCYSIISGVNVVHMSSSFADILRDFPEITNTALASRTTRHGVECFINTTGPPVRTSPRRLSPKKLEIAKKYFDVMCAAGICRRSDSPWSSGLHMVPKKDGTSRPCGDYRRLNERTSHDAYPIPHIHDFAAGLSGCTVFSKVDLMKGYHQIPVRAEDVPKTAIAMPFGLFEFLRMPFGLKTAAQTFQRLMDSVTAQLMGVFVYLAFLKARDPVSNRQRHQLAFISEFVTDIAHVLGLDNVVADALTRQYDDEGAAAVVHEVSHSLTDIDLEKLAAEQPPIGNEPASSLVLKNVQFSGVPGQVVCDTSLGRPRILVSTAWRRAVFDAIHSLAHPSGRTMLAIVARTYAWAGMRRDVLRWSRECIACATSKVSVHTKPQVIPISVPSTRFEHVHVDIVGPFAPD